MHQRICLIVPPSVFLLDERVFMSLGILKVAAVLEQSGIQVEMLDLSGVENFVEVVEDYVRASGVDCFGLTATTPQMPAATKIHRAIRAARPAARIILGGPHVTLVHAAQRLEQKRGAAGRGTSSLRMLEDMFDVLVVGDGELAISEALQDQPPKIVDGDDPKGSLFLTNQKLTDLPFPARHLLDVGSYHYTIDGVPALSMIAQLGCPFGCGFCGGRFSPFLRRIRMRTSENIVSEMVHLHRTYGTRGFMLYDDELNVNPKILELMNLIADAQAKLGVEFRLRGFMKAELFTDAQAEAMYRAGFRWILIGFESGHDRILKNIQKKATKADNTRAVEIAKRHGLKVKALMSLGHPGESEEPVRETTQWLLDVKPDDFDATIITTYPGTPYFDQAVETKPGVWTYAAPGTGDKLHSFEVDYREVAEYYKGAPGEYASYVYTDHLDSSGLVEWRDWMEDRVRTELKIPFNAGAPAVRYEHSMGQSSFPTSILRKSSGPAPRPEPFPESNLGGGCGEPVELHSLSPGIPAS
jgi:anaerobic magnesium-protoporphyrin IX monomethyl ester cyclase